MGKPRICCEAQMPGNLGMSQCEHPAKVRLNGKALCGMHANAVRATERSWDIEETSLHPTPPADMGVTVPTAGSGEGADDGR